jgi:hypothetical protein
MGQQASCRLRRQPNPPVAPDARPVPAPGGLWLGVLAAKLGLEAVRGSAFLAGGAGWASLPAAHAWGALLGLIASPLVRVNPRGSRV